MLPWDYEHFMGWMGLTKNLWAFGLLDWSMTCVTEIPCSQTKGYAKMQRNSFDIDLNQKDRVLGVIQMWCKIRFTST